MDTPVVAGLKAALSNDNVWLERSTIAVFIGVLLEMADLLFFNKEMGRWQRGILFVATILVVAGCGGEWAFEHDASQKEGQLQQISDENVASLARAEAADKKIATQAAEKAGNLGVSVNTLSSFVTTTERKATNQRDELQRFVESERKDVLGAAATAKQDVADMSVALNQERDLRDRFARLVQPRQITDAQYAALVTAIKPFPKTPVDFALTRETEPGDLVVRISDAVKEAGWSIQPWTGAGMTLTSSARPDIQFGELTARGVQIQLAESDNEKLGPAASAIWHALLAAGIPTIAARFPEKTPDGKPIPSAPKPGAIHVIVGSRD